MYGIKYGKFKLTDSQIIELPFLTVLCKEIPDICLIWWPESQAHGCRPWVHISAIVGGCILLLLSQHLLLSTTSMQFCWAGMRAWSWWFWSSSYGLVVVGGTHIICGPIITSANANGACKVMLVRFIRSKYDFQQLNSTHHEDDGLLQLQGDR